MIVVNNAVDEPWSLADGGDTAEMGGTGSVGGANSDVGDAVRRERRELVWDNGDRYEGEWLGELMDGAGTWTGADGERYVGEWRDGERHGRGLSTGADGETYDGQWEEGVEHGRGLYSDPEDGWIDALWEDGEAVRILSRGDAGEAAPELPDDLGGSGCDDGASVVGAVSEPDAAPQVAFAAGAGGAGSDVAAAEAPARRKKQGKAAAEEPVLPVGDGVAIDLENADGTFHVPETVDDVMACLRMELKNRRAMGNAKGFFAFFDADGDGDVDGDEFKTCLLLLLPMLGPELLKAVYCEVDADGDGSVDYGEFAARMFQNPGTKRRRRPGQVQKRRGGKVYKDGVAEALDPISTHLDKLKGFSYVPKQKKKPGARKDGRSVADGGGVVRLSEEEILARQVENLFRVIRQQMQGARTLYGKKLKDARQAFELMDKDGDGTLDEDEFKDALSRLGVGLSERQLVTVFEAIDTDGEGSIDYNEFVERIGLDDGDDQVGEMLTDAEALQKQLEAAEAAQRVAAGGGGLVPCAFEFAESGYTGVTFGDVGGRVEVTGIVGGPAEALGFGVYGLREGARLTAVNDQPVTPSIPFVETLRMLQKAERPLILGFDVHPVVAEALLKDGGSEWVPALVTQVRVQYDYDAAGNLSGPITRGNAVETFSVEMLPIGDGLTANELPSARVRIREETEPGEQAYTTVHYLRDKKAQKRVREELAEAWMWQADALTEHAAVEFGASSESEEKELMTQASEHYHEALGHALSVVDTRRGKELCVRLYRNRAKLLYRSSKGDPDRIALAKDDAEAAIALEHSAFDPKEEQDHEGAVLDIIMGREGKSAAAQEAQSKLREWLTAKGKTDGQAAALKFGKFWREKAARKAAPERRRRAKLCQRGADAYAKAVKLLKEVRPCGSLARVESLLTDAHDMLTRADDPGLVLRVEEVQAFVAGRWKAESKEKEERRMELAMGAAQSKIVREPYLEMFTGGPA